MKKLILLLSAFGFIACSSPNPVSTEKDDSRKEGITPFVKSDSAWKAELTPDEYAVLRNKATEKPYSGEYDNFWDSGVYVCKACGLELFYSDHKFDAGCGWPSFYKSIDSTKIRMVPDSSHGMIRTEIQCARCGGHLGHVFDDGPGEEGLRYCVNSLSLGFRKK